MTIELPELENKSGIVYVLINEAMPGYIKIGKTSTSVEQRILELSRSTAVPLPFECVYAAKVLNMSQVEAALHDAFGDHRKNPRREFFIISPERVIAILRLLAVEEVTPAQDVGVETKEDKEALEIARKKRSAFNFKMVDIPVGAILSFIRDETITCTVAEDQKHVIHNGEELSLSLAAQKILGYKWQVQGPAYWIYEGELLDERRTRMEEQVGLASN
jgi:hypothetical protein